MVEGTSQGVCVAPGREGVSVASGMSCDCQGRGSLAEVAGWLAGHRAPRGCCMPHLLHFFFIFFFWRSSLHPASCLASVSCNCFSPGWEPRGVEQRSRGAGQVGSAPTLLQSQEGGRAGGRGLLCSGFRFFFPMGAPLVSGFGWLGLETACSLLSLVPFGLVWLEAERTWS